jgi:hypothetical protein
MRLAEDPEFRRSLEASVRESMQAIAAIDARNDDPVAQCRGLVSYRDVEIRMVPIAEAQWRAIDAAYAAEARRLGISLE